MHYLNITHMETISNGKISISTQRYSAELCSLRDAATGEEYFWQADPAFWGRHCPMLFPTVGSLWDGSYLHRGVRRSLPKHGFMQDRIFDLKEHDNNAITYTAHDTAETRAMFPFKFELEQKFSLDNKTVSVEWTVRNVGCDDMPFQIGGHPSFYFRGFEPGNSVKGYLQFDAASPESATVGMGGCLGLKRYTLPATDGRLEVRDECFAGDSIIIDNNQVHCITLLDASEKPIVKVSSDAPVFLVWSPYGCNAPFVCLEPWYGLCDREWYTGEFSKRPYTNIVPAGGEWKGGYRIEVLG